MEKDIDFAVAILRAEYERRRKLLISGDLEPSRLDNVLSELECISTSIMKIEYKFS